MRCWWCGRRILVLACFRLVDDLIMTPKWCEQEHRRRGKGTFQADTALQMLPCRSTSKVLKGLFGSTVSRLTKIRLVPLDDIAAVGLKKPFRRDGSQNKDSGTRYSHLHTTGCSRTRFYTNTASLNPNLPSQSSSSLLRQQQVLGTP